MFAWLLILFTVVPAVELYLLILLGQYLGALETVLIIVLTGSVGAWLAKREGLGVLRELQQETLRGVPPGERLLEGVLVLVGGAFSITPGVMTDLTGFLLIIPWSRKLLVPLIKKAAMKRLLARGVEIGSAPGPAARRARDQRAQQTDRAVESGDLDGDGFGHPRR